MNFLPLVSRRPHSQALYTSSFDHLLYAKTVGESLGNHTMWSTVETGGVKGLKMRLGQYHCVWLAHNPVSLCLPSSSPGANKEALAVAMASGAQFIRAEGFVFSHVADEGWMDSCAAELLRYRRAIGAEDILVFTDIKKKHSWVACFVLATQANDSALIVTEFQTPIHACATTT